MAGVSGDFPRIRKLQVDFNRIANGELRKRFLEELASSVRLLVVKEFAEGRDPFGKPWAPLVGSSRTPLGSLWRSMRVDATRSGFAISIKHPGAAVHQYGATIWARRAPSLRFRVGGQWVSKRAVVIPARPYVPEDELPAEWFRAFGPAFEAALEGFGE